MQVESTVVPSLGQEHKGKGKTGDHEHVEDAEEDEALRDTDLVAAVREAKGDRVQEPQQVEPTGQHEVVPRKAQAGG